MYTLSPPSAVVASAVEIEGKRERKRERVRERERERTGQREESDGVCKTRRESLEMRREIRREAVTRNQCKMSSKEKEERKAQQQ